MKKIIKNNIFGFILGIILCGGIVYGVTLYKSEDIQYSPTDSSWEVSNVGEAINSLYNIKTELDNIKSLGDSVAGNILSGKKAVVKGNNVTGTMVNRGVLNWNPSLSTSYSVPAGYYSGGTISTVNAYNSGYNAGITAGVSSVKFNKIEKMQGTYNSNAHTVSISTGITGKELWNSIFVIPMIVPASGTANNNFYNGEGITYNSSTGIIIINAAYVNMIVDVYYIN